MDHFLYRLLHYQDITLTKYKIYDKKLFNKAADALYKHYEGSTTFRRLVRPDSNSFVDSGSIRL